MHIFNSPFNQKIWRPDVVLYNSVGEVQEVNTFLQA